MKSKLKHKVAKKRIVESGRSLRWLAMKIGIRPNTLSIYLMGQSQPSFRVVSELAKYTDCEVSELWIGDINENINRTKRQK